MSELRGSIDPHAHTHRLACASVDGIDKEPVGEPVWRLQYILGRLPSWLPSDDGLLPAFRQEHYFLLLPPNAKSDVPDEHAPASAVRLCC